MQQRRTGDNPGAARRARAAARLTTSPKFKAWCGGTTTTSATISRRRSSRIWKRTCTGMSGICCPWTSTGRTIGSASAIWSRASLMLRSTRRWAAPTNAPSAASTRRSEPTATACGRRKRWRPRSTYLHNTYGVKTYKIIDEMFVLNERHVMAICDELIERNYGLNIWAYARVDTVRSHMLEKLRKAGVRWLALGIESGSEHVRDGAEKSFSQRRDHRYRPRNPKGRHQRHRQFHLRSSRRRSRIHAADARTRQRA